MAETPARRVDPALVAACAIFLAVDLWGAGQLPASHEEISTFPSHGTRVLAPSTDPRVFVFEPSCADPRPPAVARSALGRPTLSLCAGGLTLPVLIAPYASGVLYWHALAGWPLHRGDVFALRRWDLLAGLLGLWLTHRLVRRLADDAAAGATVLVLSVLSPFTILYAFLLQYEAMPWNFTMGALLVALGPAHAAPPSARRLALAGWLAGLAVLANVKAVFFFGPILLVAWRLGALRRLGARGALAGLGAAALGALPLLLTNGLHGGGGLRSQTAQRAQLFARATPLAEYRDEAVNLLRFACDTGSYGSPEWSPIGAAGVAAIAVSALGAAYVTAAAVSLLRPSRRPDPLAAGSGLLLALFVVVSLKLYDQHPAANYGPLHGVFGIMIGLAISAAAARLARALRRPDDARRLALALAVACMIPLGANTLRRLSAVANLPIATNAHAERRLAAYLLARPRPGVTLYTTMYNLAGVLDSLGRGALPTVRLDNALPCPSADDDPAACLTARWRSILATPGVLPARVVLPVTNTESDEETVHLLVPSLLAAARADRLSAALERRFTTPAGAPAVDLFLVERGP